VRTYHIADPGCMLSADEIRHRPVGAPSTTSGIEDVTRGWLPPTGTVVVGLTAGASTPNNIVGEVIRKLESFCAGAEGFKVKG
jgi:4-hydroxy-3-methylbut-2-enyl diphosphate reductase